MNTSHSTRLYPIARGWVSSGFTGSQNSGEFTSDAEITDVIAANPRSMLAVEMPHRTPEAVHAGHDLAAALPAAVARLAALQHDATLRVVRNVVAAYRITAHPRPSSLGVFCLVDTRQITSSAEMPGMVIRNEGVFMGKVEELVTVAGALGALTSAVLLLQAGDDLSLHEFLADVIARSGEPAVSDVDHHGRLHEVWVIEEGLDQSRLLELAGRTELIVADGNHRTLAAQRGGLPNFLAMITTAPSVRIAAYNRLVRGLGGLSVAEVMARLTANGAVVTAVPSPQVPERSGTVVLYGDGRAFHVRFPAPADLDPVYAMDHWCLERELFNQVLGLDADDERIVYVGGDHSASWLLEEVDAGRSALAALLAPVSVAEFIDVNRRRQQLPRKSTWFTPKVRAGLLLAEIAPAERLNAIDVQLSSGPSIEPGSRGSVGE